MTPSAHTSASDSESGNAGLLFNSLRAFGLLVLILMLVSIVYSAWITVENWSTIGV